MYLVVDNDAINDMLEDNSTMNSLADYDAAIAEDINAAYLIADRFVNKENVTQAVIIPLDDTKVLAATLRPVHVVLEVLAWPEDEPEPLIPNYDPDNDEDCEGFE